MTDNAARAIAAVRRLDAALAAVTDDERDEDDYIEEPYVYGLANLAPLLAEALDVATRGLRSIAYTWDGEAVSGAANRSLAAIEVVLGRVGE